MQLRPFRPRPKPERKYHPVTSAVTAVGAFAVVGFLAYYSIAHPATLHDLLERVGATWAGLITIGVMLAAGGLLSFAFGRVEETLRSCHIINQDDKEADD